MNDKMAEYITQIREGDADKGFAGLFEVTRDRAYYIASALVGEANAADVLQESYIKTFEAIKRGQFDCDREFMPYLNQTIRNKSTDWLRRNRGILTEDVEEIEDDSDLVPATWLESKEKREKVQEIVDGLSPIQRAVVALYYYEDIPVAEIAEQLEISEGTVKSRLNRARLKIKEAVLQEEAKGNKLYGAGVPVLALILKQQAAAAVMPAEMASSVLQGTLSGLSSLSAGSGVAGTISAKFAALSTGAKAAALTVVSMAVIGGGLGVAYISSQPVAVEAMAAPVEEAREDITLLSVEAEPEEANEAAPESEDGAEPEAETEAADEAGAGTSEETDNAQTESPTVDAATDSLDDGEGEESDGTTATESAGGASNDTQASGNSAQSGSSGTQSSGNSGLDGGIDWSAAYDREGVHGEIPAQRGTEEFEENLYWASMDGKDKTYYREGMVLADGSFVPYANGQIRDEFPSYYN